MPLLIDVLRLGNDEVERQAAWALGRTGDPRALPALVRAVFGKQPALRMTAAAALASLSTGPQPQPADAAAAKKRVLMG